MSQATIINDIADSTNPLAALRCLMLSISVVLKNRESQIMNQTMAVHLTRLMLGPWFRNDWFSCEFRIYLETWRSMSTTQKEQVKQPIVTNMNSTYSDIWHCPYESMDCIHLLFNLINSSKQNYIAKNTANAMNRGCSFWIWKLWLSFWAQFKNDSDCLSFCVPCIKDANIISDILERTYWSVRNHIMFLRYSIIPSKWKSPTRG